MTTAIIHDWTPGQDGWPYTYLCIRYGEIFAFPAETLDEALCYAILNLDCRSGNNDAWPYKIYEGDQLLYENGLDADPASWQLSRAAEEFDRKHRDWAVWWTGGGAV